MSIDEKKLQESLRAQFFADAEEPFEQMDHAITMISSDLGVGIKGLMRSCHNLKGSSQLAGFSELATMIHEMESVFEKFLEKSIDADQLQVLSLLSKRLVGIARKTFEALSGGAEVTHRDQASWQAGIDGLLILATSAATASSQDASAPRETLETMAANDDWGLGLAIADEAKAESATSDSIIATNTVNQEPVVDKPVDWSKGWGLFEDMPSPVVPAFLEQNDQQLNVAESSRASVSQSNESSNEHIKRLNEEVLQRQLTAASKPKSATYLLCKNGDATFAFPVTYVQEILPNQSFKKLPINRPKIAGVISFRGQVMAILNLFDHLNSNEQVDDRSRCIVVCRIDRKQFGFRIDEVVSVVEVDESSLQGLPGVSSEESFVRHLAQIEGRTVSFIDPVKAIL